MAQVDVKPDVQDRFVKQTQTRLEGTVWTSGCKSWYINDSGKNTTLWPGFTFKYRRITSAFEMNDYAVKTRHTGTTKASI